jgi:leucyl-tRNA synthetase
MYPFKHIEKKWQSYWEKHSTFRTPSKPDTSKPKYYVLDMFPYPSGDGLHVGHPEGYTASDIIARYKRMKGFNVLHPMGWDAFGLPAEQYAIKTGAHPKVTTNKNITKFRSQLKSLGFSYDWSLEINTTSPDYYKWTQWIFKKMFDAGLAYQSEMPVWWCEELGTTLANEEVIDGKSEVGGFPCERRPLRQWMLRITDYSEKLLAGLDQLDWPKSTMEMQKNWIGKSLGAEISFDVNQYKNIKINIYTTRPDTIFGATYLVLSPEHSLVESITTTDNMDAIKLYQVSTSKKSELERTSISKNKTGVFTGSYAVNPVNKKLIPIWIADYVLAHYGTGAIMAVPGEDQRDWEFAKKYNLPVIRTIAPPNNFIGEAYTGEGKSINSEFLNDLPIAVAKKKIIDWLEKYDAGKEKINYKLRDWLFSRQRYWGEPFPIYFKDGIAHTVDEKDLPVTLPDLQDFKPSGSPEGPLSKATEWINFGNKNNHARRETNTMPQWAGSCWYYLRFIDPHNKNLLIDPELEAYWMPVDLYVGGSEHAVLHLLYARFWHKFLNDIGVTSTSEPFKKLIHQGMILGEVEFYAYQGKTEFVSADAAENMKHKVTGEELQLVRVDKKNVILIEGAHYLKRSSDILLELKSQKMSKSRGNVINPDEIINDYGADALRLYEMFMGPLEQVKPWNTRGVEGTFRFLNRAWSQFISKDDLTLSNKITLDEPSNGESKIIAKAIDKVTNDIEEFKFNTAISALMECLNALNKLSTLSKETVESFVILLSPLAPHLAEELWSYLGHNNSIAYVDWPIADANLLVNDNFELPIQVNGKVRAKLTYSFDTPEDLVIETAKRDATIHKYLTNGKIKKTIYVPQKILNFVIID